MGGELNSITKDHSSVRGKLAFAFPDTYSLGMSHHGMEVLYTLMNRRDDWLCERTFCPWVDFEQELRDAELPLYGWKRSRRSATLTCWDSRFNTKSARSTS